MNSFTDAESAALPSDDPDRFLRFLTASIPVLLSYISPDLRFRYANDAYAQWFGRTPTEVIGKTVSEVIGETAFENILPFLEEALSGRSVTFERKIPYTDTDTRIVHVTYVPDLGGGAVRGVAAVVTDITAHRGAERLLEESRQRYQSLFEHHPDAVFSFDLTGTFVSANAACETLSGYTVVELLGTSFLPMLAPEDADRALRYFALAVRGAPQNYEVAIAHKQGRQVWIEVTNIPIVVGGAIVGVYGVAKDVTERRRAETDRRQAQDELALVVARARCLLWYADVSGWPGGVLHWETRFADEEALRGFGIEAPPGQDVAVAWYLSRLEEDRVRDDANAARHIWAGQDYSQEFRCARADGSLFWMQEDVRVETVAPNHWRLVGVSTDITARKLAEAERERLLQEAQDGAVRQRAFLRDVLASVTDGRLHLCGGPQDLPRRLPPFGGPVTLSRKSGLWALRHLAEEAAFALEFAQERCYDLMTAVSEAGMNAIIHAGGGRGRVGGDGWGRIQVRIEDHGAGIAMEQLPRATLERGYSTASTFGHGMKMMLQMTDRVFLLTGPTGTTVVLEQDRQPTVPEWLAI